MNPWCALLNMRHTLHHTVHYRTCDFCIIVCIYRVGCDVVGRVEIGFHRVSADDTAYMKCTLSNDTGDCRRSFHTFSNKL